MEEYSPGQQRTTAEPPRWVAESGNRLIGLAALVGIAYYVGAQVGFALRFPTSPISMLWPPNSLLLAAFLLTPMRRWWVVLAAALPAHLAVQIQNDVPPATMLGLFLTNSGQGLLGAAALRRFDAGPYRLDSLRRVGLFLICAAVMAPLVIAFVASALIVGTAWGEDYWLSWRAQFLSNVLTVITLVPPILAIAASETSWFRKSAIRRWAEAGLLGVGLVVASWLMFSNQLTSAADFPALLYAPLPLLLWAALRFGTGGISLSVLFVAVWAVVYAADGPGPFGELTPFENVVSLQLYLIAVTVPLLTLAALLRERELTERMLRASEERYRTVVQAAPIGIATQDATGHLTAANRAWIDFLGYRPEDLVKGDFWAVTHPDDVPRNRALFEELKSGAREGYSMEKRYYRKDGRLVWGGLTVAAARDEDGSLRHTIAMVQDITNRKRAEDALRESETRLRTQYQALPLPTFTWQRVGGDFIFIDFNHAAETLAPSPLAPRIGQRIAELFPDYPEVTKQVARCFDGQVIVQHELRARLRDPGTELDLIVTDIFVSPDLVVMHIEDITERKRAEDALRESETRFRMMADHAPVMIWVLDEGGRATFFNKAILQFLGLSLECALALWKEAIHPEDREHLCAIGEPAWLARRPFEAEYRARRADGTYRWLANQAVPRLASDGTFLGYIGSAIDITERKRAEEDLHQLSARLLQVQDEERRRIARDLHDVTAQDLFALTINLARLQQLVPAPDRAIQELLADCRALGDQSLHELRTLSYLLHPPLLDQVGLVSALEWYVDGFRQRSNIDVALTISGEIEHLSADVETALFRIVQEGLANIHHHSGSETASIILDRVNGRISLRLEDQGRGMGHDYAAESATGLPPLGIGIPGMRERVRQLGGSLEIESNAHGTTVTAVVPVKEEGER